MGGAGSKSETGAASSSDVTNDDVTKLEAQMSGVKLTEESTTIAEKSGQTKDAETVGHTTQAQVESCSAVKDTSQADNEGRPVDTKPTECTPSSADEKAIGSEENSTQHGERNDSAQGIERKECDGHGTAAVCNEMGETAQVETSEEIGKESRGEHHDGCHVDTAQNRRDEEQSAKQHGEEKCDNHDEREHGRHGEDHQNEDRHLGELNEKHEETPAEEHNTNVAHEGHTADQPEPHHDVSGEIRGESQEVVRSDEGSSEHQSVSPSGNETS